MSAGFNQLVEIKSSNEAESAQGLVDYTLEEVEPSATDFRPSNSETVIDAHFDEIRRQQQVAYGSSFTALRANAEIGERLVELRKQLPHGSFEREVKARVGIERAWCARLRQLAKHWVKIQTAIKWAMTTNRLERTEISVDYAISLLRTWQHEVVEGGNNDLATPTGDSPVGKEKISRKQLEQKIDDLRRKLEEAYQEIMRLTAEVEWLKKQLCPDALLSDHTMLSSPTVEVIGE